MVDQATLLQQALVSPILSTIPEHRTLLCHPTARKNMCSKLTDSATEYTVKCVAHTLVTPGTILEKASCSERSSIETIHFAVVTTYACMYVRTRHDLPALQRAFVSPDGGATVRCTGDFRMHRRELQSSRAIGRKKINTWYTI